MLKFFGTRLCEAIFGNLFSHISVEVFSDVLQQYFLVATMEVSEDEKKMIEALRALGATPKADTKEDLQGWMTAFLQQQGVDSGITEVKQELTSEEKPTPDPSQRLTLHNSPRLPVFAGTPSKKDDASYDLWRYEVVSLLRGHGEDSTMEAIRRSLRGEAARAAMHLGPLATAQQILRKFDSIYGQIDLQEDLLASFYSAKQEEGESVSEWGCRLEDILSQAAESGRYDRLHTDEMIRCKFYSGLQPSLKDVLGHKFDSIKDFDQLRIAARQVEQSRTTTKKQSGPRAAQVHLATAETTSDLSSRMDKLEGMLQQMMGKLD